jgi:hypothetical protein
MAKPKNQIELNALKNLLMEIHLILSTSPSLPQGRTPRSLELLRAALALTDDLIGQAKLRPAAILGHKGGTSTMAKLGSEHFRQLAAQRKTRAGGRPRKQQ